MESKPSKFQLKRVLVQGKISPLKESRQLAGAFGELLKYEEWTGNRLRVVGTEDGLPVTENAGPWKISIKPTDSASVIEIKGLFFAHDRSVCIDLAGKTLFVGDAAFVGSEIGGKSPMFQNTEFTGYSFKNDEFGSAAILFLNDGRLVLDFHKTIVDGTRAQECGVLAGRKTVD